MAARYLTDGKHDDKDKGCGSIEVPWTLLLTTRATRSEGTCLAGSLVPRI